MKKINTLIVLALLTLSFGCKKQAAVATTTTASKATLSSWAISNSSFSVRLDLNGANLNGTSFTLIYKCSDNTEVWCPSTSLTGPSDHGSYNIAGTCIDNGGMSTSYLGVFETGGVGTYTNSGTGLSLCKFNGSCLSYH
jgi:hypothetical protein